MALLEGESNYCTYHGVPPYWAETILYLAIYVFKSETHIRINKASTPRRSCPLLTINMSAGKIKKYNNKFIIKADFFNVIWLKQ